MPRPSRYTRFGSSNTKSNTKNHWKNFCKWWDDNSESFNSDLDAFPKKIFQQKGRANLFSKPCEVIMFQVTHLQWAHILKHYVKSLQPKVDGDKALKGNTIKNYLDAIQRKMHQMEREDNSLYSWYGNWAWSQNDSPYLIVKTAIDDYVMREAVGMVETKCWESW